MQASPEVRFYVKMTDTYIPGMPPGSMVFIEIGVETTEPLVAWTMSLAWDPAVLSMGYDPDGPGPVPPYEAFEGPFLSAWCTAYPWPNGTTFVKGTINNAGGKVTTTSCGINNWKALPAGAGPTGTGTLVYYYFTSLSMPGTYSILDLYDCEYGTTEGTFYPDIVDDGHYGGPPPVPEFPLGSIAPIALIAAIAYIWWVTRRKRQEAV